MRQRLALVLLLIMGLAVTAVAQTPKIVTLPALTIDNRVKVPAGTSVYFVIVYYGNAILPATFTATLDGADVSAQFHPVPGGSDVFRVPIGASTTKLQLSVTGVKASGGRGTDSDTLTFLPQ